MNNQLYLPKLTPINKYIIIISAVMFVVNFLLSMSGGASLLNIIGLSASDILSGHVYKFLTYPFGSRSLLELILNSLMLWLMASEFETNWGQKRYIKFLLATVIGGGLLYVLVAAVFFGQSAVFDFELVGLSGIVSAMCLAYAIIFPDRVFSFMMVIPVKAKYFCFLLIIISLFQGLSGPSGVGAWGQLGAILAAFIFMLLTVNKKGLLGNFLGGSALSARNKSKKSNHLKLVKDDEDKNPKYWQ